MYIKFIINIIYWLYSYRRMYFYKYNLHTLSVTDDRLPVTCYLIGLGTSINFFIVVFRRAFNVFLGTNVWFDLNVTVESIDRIW